MNFSPRRKINGTFLEIQRRCRVAATRTDIGTLGRTRAQDLTVRGVPVLTKQTAVIQRARDMPRDNGEERRRFIREKLDVCAASVREALRIHSFCGILQPCPRKSSQAKAPRMEVRLVSKSFASLPWSSTIKRIKTVIEGVETVRVFTEGSFGALML
jgi:hypothetical protein